ncbi:tetratricopeptide repeat protein [Emticicia fluvialis]|uniref:tetratricopeptide repeat protein n=1 Tax=Emticicia fluvialis TaxID=2974474 RepID=UPI0021652EC1|nr:tetratricopeptide repeat protein [Emticicia fluvialis]
MKRYFNLPWHYFALVVLVTCIVYSNHFYNAFHFDDSHTVVNNLYIRSLKNISLFFKDATTFSTLPANQAYRPVVTTSLAIDYWLGNGYNLFYFHLFTFIIFLVQGWLMLLLFKKLFDVSFQSGYNYFIALAAVAWYLLHPAMAETVNYVIARSDTLSTFFVVLAFVMYARSGFCRRTFLYLIPVAIGALAKPTAVMFAPILFFYVILFEKNLSLTDFFRVKHFRQILNAVARTLPAFVVCALLYGWIDRLTPKTWEAGGTSAWHYLITQPFVIAYYFSSLFLPVHLNADTDWKVLTSIWDIRFFAGIVFLAVMLVLAIWCSKNARTRPISFGIIWFFLALVPSSSVIPLGEVMNDHRMFFPFVGLVMSVVWAMALFLMPYKNFFKKHAVAAIAIFAVVLLCYGAGTYQRNKVWHTEESLWYDVTIKSPENARGLMNYGISKMGKNDFETAEKYFNKALVLTPGYYTLHINMGVLKEAQGDSAIAESYFKNALLFNNKNADSWYYYARFLFNQGRYPEAIQALLNTTKIAPGYIPASELLMRIHDRQQHYEKLHELADETLKRVPGNAEALVFKASSARHQSRLSYEMERIRLDPSPEKYLSLSFNYYLAGELRQSIKIATEAIKLRPDYPEAYNNIGSAYNVLKEYDKAIPYLQKAVDLSPNFELAKNNLKMAEIKKNEINR